MKMTFESEGMDDYLEVILSRDEMIDFKYDGNIDDSIFPGITEDTRLNITIKIEE